MTSLADLRKTKDQPASRPTRIVKACLDQALLADIQRLTVEKTDLLMSAPLDGDGEQGENGPPRRVGQGMNPRIAEIDAELEPLYQRLRDAEGEILLSATDGGTWLRWKDAHPAREKNEVDERLAYGLANATDLLEDLGKYVVSWNGDDFGPGEWDWFSQKVAPADLGACISAVVELHESRISAPKLRSVSSEPPTSATDSTSPAA
jgi:hypothetical protein